MVSGGAERGVARGAAGEARADLPPKVPRDLPRQVRRTPTVEVERAPSPAPHRALIRRPARCAPVSAPTTPVPVTDADLAAFVQQHPLVVIDAWAPWCPPCKRLDPIFQELAAEYGGAVAIGKINTDENQRTASRFGIMSLPTILVFRDGQRVDQFVGFAAKETLRQRFAKSFGL